MAAKCKDKNCSIDATHTVSRKLPSGEIKYTHRCGQHLNHRSNEMREAGSQGTYVHLCIPCMGTGKQPRFAHVSRGVCFRCQGTGIMGVKTEIK